MAGITTEAVRAYFDENARKGGSRLPDPATVGGLGTYIKYRKAADLMADPSVGRALDVGCNRGQVELLFHTLHPTKAQSTLLEGVDIAPEAVRQARELGLPNCTFQAYDGSVLPFPSGQFDLAVLVEVIEHVEEPARLLREIRRVLRPGGRLFLTTPNPRCMALRVECAMWYILRRLFGRPELHKDAFLPPTRLAQLLREAGFENGAALAYSWPHLFIHFLGWSILPPLPPRALYYYQRLCMRLFQRPTVPLWLKSRVMWTLGTLATASSWSSEAGSRR